MSGRIEWCEIGGLPTDEERQIVTALLEQYLRGEADASPSPWTLGKGPVERQAAPAWSGPNAWNGLKSDSEPV